LNKFRGCNPRKRRRPVLSAPGGLVARGNRYAGIVNAMHSHADRETSLHPDDEICFDAIIIDATASYRRESPNRFTKSIMRLYEKNDLLKYPKI